MTWKTSLAIVTTSLILAGTAAAQAPPHSGRSGPPPRHAQAAGRADPPRQPRRARRAPRPPGVPGTPTPGATPPGSPSLNNPSGTNPTFPCPPGQGRRPGSTASCTPGAPTQVGGRERGRASSTRS